MARSSPSESSPRIGDPGKRPLNTREPKPAVAMPACPAHLKPSAKGEWKRLARQLHDIGILSNLDRAILAGYCQAYGRWVEAEKKLKETPAILKMPSGYLQQNPWLTIAAKQLELMHRYMVELGLTPAARSRVQASSPPGPSKFAGLLGQLRHGEDPAKRYFT